MNRFNRTEGGWLRLLRRYPRVRLDAPVALAYKGRALLVQAIDICEGGIGLELPAPLPDGVEVTLSFYLPTSVELIELSGIVVHPVARKSGLLFCGLAFKDMSATQRKLLRRYINNRRFLHGDLRAPTDNADVGKRMTERLGRVRRLTLLT